MSPKLTYGPGNFLLDRHPAGIGAKADGILISWADD